LVILPEQVWTKVEGFGEVDVVHRPMPKPEGFGPNMPGRSGFRAAGAHFVGSLGRCTTSTSATLRVDRLAVRETELTKASLILL